MLIIIRQINYSKLRGIIAEKNIKREELCEIWHCSRQSVYGKLNGAINMTECEAKAFSKYAELNNVEKKLIFSTSKI